jgi:hypothetical protein
MMLAFHQASVEAPVGLSILRVDVYASLSASAVGCRIAVAERTGAITYSYNWTTPPPGRVFVYVVAFAGSKR